MSRGARSLGPLNLPHPTSASPFLDQGQEMEEELFLRIDGRR